MLRNNYPNLYLVLSDRYCTDVPGFVHIKWNDDLHSITKYLKENIGFSSDKILNVAIFDSVPTRHSQFSEAPRRDCAGVWIE